MLTSSVAYLLDVL